MGKVVEKSKGVKKKKKGRPSLLDLQKRSLKQQHKLLNKHLRNKLKNQQQLNNQQPTTTTTTATPSPTTSSSSRRRSTRRNPNPNSDSDDARKRKKQKKLKHVLKEEEEDEEDEVDGDGEEEEEGELEVEEREYSCDDGSAPDGNDARRTLRKRKIGSISSGSAAPLADVKVEKQPVVATNQTNNDQGSKEDDGPTTPLPDKKLLLFILDRLQKKDTYGVFAEPVDPEELPDYFEVIDDPMDFGTVRKKLDDAAYASLEQFEKDVFLICSNAMQYNAPETIYFRQARSILDLAKKNLDNLRQDSDDNELDPEPKVVRRGRPPTKHLKRPPGRPPLERANSDVPEATLKTPVGSINRVNDFRKGSSPLKYGSADSFARSLYGSHNTETYGGSSAERFERSDDLTGSAPKGISLWLGKKKIVLEETRTSYKHPYALACGDESSVLHTFNGERKQLIAVGLHSEYGYARSLARFAAKLGPVAWNVASRRIERCLPPGVKFGPGWVGENEAPAERPSQQLPNASGQSSGPATMPASSADPSSAPVQSSIESSADQSEQKPQVEQLSVVQKPAARSSLDNESNKLMSPPVAVNNSIPVSSASPSSNGVATKSTTSEATPSISPSSNMVSTSTGPLKSENSIRIHHQTPTTQPRVNGVNGTYGLNFAAQMGKMIGAGRPTVFNFQSNPPVVPVLKIEPEIIVQPSADSSGTVEAKVPANSTTIEAANGSSPNTGPQQKTGSKPPDLNVGVQSPGSPSPGKADSVQQPDLALQL